MYLFLGYECTGGELGFHTYLTTRLRFGDWKDIVADTAITPRVWHYADVLRAMTRGLAFLQLQDMASAQVEYAKLQVALPLINVTAYVTLGTVANATLRSALALFAQPSDPTTAIAVLKAAASVQHSWPYVSVCLLGVVVGVVCFVAWVCSFEWVVYLTVRFVEPFIW